MLPRRGAWHEYRSCVLKKILIAETPREEIQHRYILQVGDSPGFEGLYIYDRTTEVNHQNWDWLLGKRSLCSQKIALAFLSNNFSLV